jgi:hypothetical protein
VNDGKWRFGVVTCNGTGTATGVHIYINGVEDTYGTQVNTTGTRGTDATRNFVIGKRFTTSGAGPFNGAIDDLCVWNRALAASEVRQLYDATSRRYDPTLSWIWPVTYSPPASAAAAGTTPYYGRLVGGM